MKSLLRNDLVFQPISPHMLDFTSHEDECPPYIHSEAYANIAIKRMKLVITPQKRKLLDTTSKTKRKADSHQEHPALSLRVVYMSEQQSNAHTPLPILSLTKTLPRNLQLGQRNRLVKQKVAVKLETLCEHTVDFDEDAMLHCERIGMEFMHLVESTERKAFTMVKWGLLTNTALRRDYSVLEILGWGGMSCSMPAYTLGCGTVVAAIRRSDSSKVAIKLIYKKKRSASVAEIDILRMLSSPNIVSYIDHFEDTLITYLVMENFGSSWRQDIPVSTLVIDPEKCDSCPKRHCVVCEKFLVKHGQASCSSLYDFIEFHNQRVPMPLVLLIFRHVAQGLAYCHSKGIVHGDIKEENVLIGHSFEGRASDRVRSKRISNDDASNLVAKLCDMGHGLKSTRTSKTMIRYGTREVSAPELFPQLRKDDESDARFSGFEQDIYALGFLLYSMLFGNLPADLNDYISGKKEFMERHYPIDGSGIDRDCHDLLRRMLCIDYKHRITAENVLGHAWLRKRSR